MDITAPITLFGELVPKSCLLRLDGTPHASSDLQKIIDNADRLSNYSLLTSLAPSNQYTVDRHIIPCQHIRQYPRATSTAQEDVLQLVVKQYTPLENLNPQYGDVTIIAAHANGLMKELLEPLWDDLLASARAVCLGIRGIWIADVAHQGESGILNERKIGNDPSWFDHSRDLLHMINQFRASMPQPLIGIGHSMGGCQLVHLSLMHPRLFESLILIDPVIQRYTFGKGKQTPAHASAYRKDRWPSRAAAAEYCSRSSFYQSWDPRVLQRWIENGFRDLPSTSYPKDNEHVIDNALTNMSASTTSGLDVIGNNYMQVQERPVTLTTSRHQEVLTFARPALPPSTSFDPTSPSSPISSSSTTPSSLLTSSSTTPIETSSSLSSVTIPASKASRSTLTLPDLDPLSHDPETPFYRPEPIQTFHQLPYLRPPVLYIFGTSSPISTPSMRAEKMAITGVGVGGSRGPGLVSMFKDVSTMTPSPHDTNTPGDHGNATSNNNDDGQTVQEVVVSEGNAGHLVPFEQVSCVANEIVAWIGAPKTRRKWMEGMEREKKEWIDLPAEEKRRLADGFLEWLRRDGGSMVGMRSKL